MRNIRIEARKTRVAVVAVVVVVVVARRGLV
jgi:hypothetical protein